MTLALGLVALLVLAALGLPLFAVIAGVALLGFHLAGYDPIVVAVEMYRLGDMPGVEIKEGRGRAKILSGLKIMFPTSTPSSIVQGWKDKQSDGI